MKSFSTFLLVAALSAASSVLGLAQNVATQPTEINANRVDMTSTDTETTSVFDGNVVLTGTNLRITCDRLEVVAHRSGDTKAAFGKVDRFKSLIATGNVRILQGDREAACGRAIVLPGDDKLILQELPVLIDHAVGWTYRGDELEMHRGQRKVTGKNPRIVGPALKDLGVDKDKLLVPAKPANSAPATATDTPKQP